MVNIIEDLTNRNIDDYKKNIIRNGKVITDNCYKENIIIDFSDNNIVFCDKKSINNYNLLLGDSISILNIQSLVTKYFLTTNIHFFNLEKLVDSDNKILTTLKKNSQKHRHLNIYLKENQNSNKIAKYLNNDANNDEYTALRNKINRR